MSLFDRLEGSTSAGRLSKLGDLSSKPQPARQVVAAVQAAAKGSVGTEIAISLACRGLRRPSFALRFNCGDVRGER